jgi:hypothetical protein
MTEVQVTTAEDSVGKNWSMHMPGDLQTLTPEQLETLRRFALLQAGVEDVRRALAKVFEFELTPERRTASTNFGCLNLPS